MTTIPPRTLVSIDTEFTPESGWKSVSPDRLHSLLAGCVGVEETPRGLQVWRLDPSLRPFIPEELLPLVLTASGARFSLQTRASAVRLRVACVERLPSFDRPRLFDVFVDGVKVGGAEVPDDIPGSLLIRVPAEGTKRIDVYFPTHRGVIVEGVDLPDGEECRPPARGQRWITHGSSITHCAAAKSPGFTWPAVVAREMNWEFWNLGFAGQCKFDQVVARTIARMPADRISLCLGINTVFNSYAPRTWRSAVEGFLLTVRDGHPETPLLVIFPILSPPREEENDEPGRIALKTMRQILKDIVGRFQATGDANIYYLDGLKLIGPGDEHCMPDQLHPDADGVDLLGRRFLQHMPPGWAGKQKD
jgi:hypothetical protein